TPWPPVVAGPAAWRDAPGALAIADPGRDLDRGPTGPLRPVTPDCVETARAALDLSRSAGLLPAPLPLGPTAAELSVSVDDIAHERNQPAVEIVARARL